jgi:hypothetical protein
LKPTASPPSPPGKKSGAGSDARPTLFKIKIKIAMKQTSLYKIIIAALFIFALMLALAPVARAMDDTNLKVSQTNAVAAATNYTASIDLGNAAPSVVWKQGYIRAEIPALPQNTNSAVTRTFVLETSTNNSTWTQTAPVIQGEIAGATVATNTATTLRIPIPPDVKRYIRVRQGNPAAGGNDSTVTNAFYLTVP